MISVEHTRVMARYNEWQNRSLYTAAEALGESARKQDRAAFFGSIHGTLSHLVWGDRLWLSRFRGEPRPAGGGIKESSGLFIDWQQMQLARAELDQQIIAWADALDSSWLYGNLSWVSGVSGREITRPRWLLVTHFFNHQTHHRGQVHAMLTAAGAKPDDTDLMLLRMSSA